jgi:formate--tetrahydrofolate ligase
MQPTTDIAKSLGLTEDLLDPKQMGAPSGWTLTISEVSLSAGAGFVVAIAGSMMLMPGLGKVPQAQKLDVDDQGRAIGMDC